MKFVFWSRFGRKAALLWLNLFPMTSWVLLYFASSPVVLCIARFLGGFWLGIVNTVVPIYVGEIAEPKVRGSLGTFFSTMTYVGVLMEYVVGPYVRHGSLILLSGSIPVLFFVCFSMVPESPYFHFMQEDQEGARRSLQWLRGTSHVEGELSEIRTAVRKQMVNAGSWKDVFATKGNTKAVVTVCVLFSLQATTGVGAMIAYVSITLPGQVFGVLGPHECVIIFGSGLVVAGIISTVLIDRFGRRILLILTTIICGGSVFAISVWFYLQTSDDSIKDLNWVPFVCICVFSFSYSLGLGPVVPAIKGEFFPANLKGPDSAIVSIAHALSCFTVNKTYLPLAHSFGFHVNYLIYTLVCIALIVFTLTSVMETKGKTLQEIQDKLNGLTKNMDNPKDGQKLVDAASS